MEKIRLGKTEMMVTKLGFGGIPIQRASEDEAIAVVRKCVELGITFIDTANSYTMSEERIGKAISGQRQNAIIATKSLARSPEEIQAHLELSLSRLKVDVIDLYQFHNVSDFVSLKAVLKPNGPMKVLKSAVQDGIIRHVGITSHNMDVAREAVKSDQFETLMFPFNCIAHEPAEELLSICREYDVGFIAMKPLAGGVLEDIDIAFKYLFQFPDVAIIPGIEKISEIEEIVSIFNEPQKMTKSEEHKLRQIRKNLGNRFCRRCDYCQPCPQGTPISLVLQTKSLIRRLPTERLFSGKMAEALDKMAQCNKCGDCEDRCPYELPIRDMIEELYEIYQRARRKYQSIKKA